MAKAKEMLEQILETPIETQETTLVDEKPIEEIQTQEIATKDREVLHNMEISRILKEKRRSQAEKMLRRKNKKLASRIRELEANANTITL